MAVYPSPYTGQQVDEAVSLRPVIIDGASSSIPIEDAERLFGNQVIPLILDASNMSPAGGYIPCVYQKVSTANIYIYGVTVKQGGSINECYVQLRYGILTSTGALNLSYKAYALSEPTQQVFEVK